MQFRLSTLLVAIAIAAVAIWVLVDLLTPRKPNPLTDRSLQLMSDSRYALAYIDYHQEPFKQIELAENEFETMRLLFRSLSPILKSRPGKIENPDYSLNYHAGMDPSQLDVKINGDKLDFGFGNFIHTGGDSKEFLKLLPYQ